MTRRTSTGDGVAAFDDGDAGTAVTPAPRSRRTTRPIRDADRTRAAVLAAATVEFTDHGFGGARIDRIARGAKINKQLIYYYFGSKEKLYIAVLEAAYAAIRAAENELRLTDLDPAESIEALTRFTWNYHVAHPDLISLVRTENLHKAKYLKQSRRITGLNSPLIANVREILRRGAKQGQFRADADPLDVYFTIASLSAYYLGNRWTLETNFGRDMIAPKRLAAWGDHIVEVVRCYLAPPAKPTRRKTQSKTRSRT